MDKRAVILIVIVALYCLKEQIPFPLFRLPGDIYYDDGRWKVGLPIMSCVVISLVVSFVMDHMRHR